LGEIALEEGEYQKAIIYFKEIEKLVLDKKYNNKKSSILHNLGLCYTNLKDYDRAGFYLNESRKLQEIEKDTVLLIGTYMDLAILKYTINDKKEAENFFTDAYNLSKKIKDYNLKKTASLNMSFLNELKGNTSLALEFRKEYEQWTDSVNDQNKIWEVVQLEKEFAVKQKQKEVSLLQAENKIKIAERNGLLYSAIVLLLLLGTAVYFYREKIKHNKIILSQKEELDELNATKDKLFSIVSHDLRSSVSALKKSNTKLFENLETKNFIELDKLIQNNSAIANGAYNLLDNLLNWALLQTKQMYFKKESLHLVSVIQQIEYNYKPLMLDKNISFENRVSKSIFVFADLDSLKIILRNLLDNAIKFSGENDSILIYNRNTNDDFCNLVIEDSGLGMDENTRLELLKESVLLSKKKNNEIVGTGLGMQLCKTMIKKNGGKLAIESQENIGTKTIIILPKFENHG
jgi:signal transduction histidine kinase